MAARWRERPENAAARFAAARPRDQHRCGTTRFRPRRTGVPAGGARKNHPARGARPFGARAPSPRSAGAVAHAARPRPAPRPAGRRPVRPRPPG